LAEFHFQIWLNFVSKFGRILFPNMEEIDLAALQQPLWG